METVEELRNLEMKAQIAMTISQKKEGESDVRNRCHRHKHCVCFATHEDDVKEENDDT